MASPVGGNQAGSPSETADSTQPQPEPITGLTLPGPNAFARQAIRRELFRQEGNAFYQQARAQGRLAPPTAIHPAFRAQPANPELQLVPVIQEPAVPTQHVGIEVRYEITQQSEQRCKCCPDNTGVCTHISVPTPKTNTSPNASLSVTENKQSSAPAQIFTSLKSLGARLTGSKPESKPSPQAEHPDLSKYPKARALIGSPVRTKSHSKKRMSLSSFPLLPSLMRSPSLRAGLLSRRESNDAPEETIKDLKTTPTTFSGLTHKRSEPPIRPVRPSIGLYPSDTGPLVPANNSYMRAVTNLDRAAFESIVIPPTRSSTTASTRPKNKGSQHDPTRPQQSRSSNLARSQSLQGVPSYPPPALPAKDTPPRHIRAPSQPIPVASRAQVGPGSTPAAMPPNRLPLSGPTMEQLLFTARGEGVVSAVRTPHPQVVQQPSTRSMRGAVVSGEDEEDHLLDDVLFRHQHSESEPERADNGRPSASQSRFSTSSSGGSEIPVLFRGWPAEVDPKGREEAAAGRETSPPPFTAGAAGSATDAPQGLLLSGLEIRSAVPSLSPPRTTFRRPAAPRGVDPVKRAAPVRGAASPGQQSAIERSGRPQQAVPSLLETLPPTRFSPTPPRGQSIEASPRRSFDELYDTTPPPLPPPRRTLADCMSSQGGGTGSARSGAGSGAGVVAGSAAVGSPSVARSMRANVATAMNLVVRLNAINHAMLASQRRETHGSPGRSSPRNDRLTMNLLVAQNQIHLLREQVRNISELL